MKKSFSEYILFAVYNNIDSGHAKSECLLFK